MLSRGYEGNDSESTRTFIEFVCVFFEFTIYGKYDGNEKNLELYLALSICHEMPDA